MKHLLILFPLYNLLLAWTASQQEEVRIRFQNSQTEKGLEMGRGACFAEWFERFGVNGLED